MDLRHKKGTRQLLGPVGDLLYFFPKHRESKMSPKFKGREKRNFLNIPAKRLDWDVVLECTRGRERTFLGTTVVFLSKPHACLQMQSTLASGDSIPRPWVWWCALTGGRLLHGALPAGPDKGIPTNEAPPQSPVPEEDLLYF